jgi:hypothetical protein
LLATRFFPKVKLKSLQVEQRRKPREASGSKETEEEPPGMGQQVKMTAYVRFSSNF